MRSFCIPTFPGDQSKADRTITLPTGEPGSGEYRTTVLSEWVPVHHLGVWALFKRQANGRYIVALARIADCPLGSELYRRSVPRARAVRWWRRMHAARWPSWRVRDRLSL